MVLRCADSERPVHRIIIFWLSEPISFLVRVLDHTLENERLISWHLLQTD